MGHLWSPATGHVHVGAQARPDPPTRASPAMRSCSSLLTTASICPPHQHVSWLQPAVCGPPRDHRLDHQHARAAGPFLQHACAGRVARRRGGQAAGGCPPRAIRAACWLISLVRAKRHTQTHTQRGNSVRQLFPFLLGAWGVVTAMPGQPSSLSPSCCCLEARTAASVSCRRPRRRTCGQGRAREGLGGLAVAGLMRVNHVTIAAKSAAGCACRGLGSVLHSQQQLTGHQEGS